MARQKLTSRILEKAKARAMGLQAIDPNISFGDACDLQKMMELIETLSQKLDAHNQALEVVDTSTTELNVMEKSLNQLSQRILLGVACRYGNDSSQYKIAGGVRKSDRIRKARATRIKKAKAKSALLNNQV
ncbi:hypothetical protein H6G33_08235 [Calothrix sp. FACHB-1219]|uniref:hypothetical protein n=1 Tax=unclassified Calothrix TaxID=2619626 RepID=UPI001684AD71|nr:MULTISPECIES: hypothetical protein [unclassified Calothrix]MBD2201982.1 hypothetical protein [Calothrix sp. FACHB-168]MBD2217018.1 hypothetical protein [Calothrix sp. FACHB-1219]